MRPDAKPPGIVHRICAILPVIFSLLAFGVVLLAVYTGRGMDRHDEGTAAHIFHLLIAAQLPLIAGYALTADWAQWRKTLWPMLVQAAAIVLAFSPVAYFHL